MARYHLVIGNKNYSSWSMRPWIAMRQFGLDFEETVIQLDQPSTARRIGRHSRAGRVPVLHDGKITVWESLAILEYLAEANPRKAMWPRNRAARAMARAAANEMHAGFAALRDGLADEPPASEAAAFGADRPRCKSRHRAHRAIVARLPQGLWQGRAVSIRTILDRRCDVCAGGHALRYLCDRGRQGNAARTWTRSFRQRH